MLGYSDKWHDLEKTVSWEKENKECIFEQWTRGQNLHKAEYCVCIEVMPIIDINDYLEKLTAGMQNKCLTRRLWGVKGCNGDDCLFREDVLLTRGNC